MKTSSRIFLFGLLLGLLPARAVQGQTEMERERNTLAGAEGFYLSVNVEGARPVVEQEALDVRRLTRRIATRLREAGLTVLEDAHVPAAERVPYLHVHVNTMEADRGQIPFAVEARFYQAVRLARAPSIHTVASTWETGLVGLAYHDQVPFIADTAVGLVGDFIDDFRRVNP